MPDPPLFAWGLRELPLRWLGYAIPFAESLRYVVTDDNVIDIIYDVHLLWALGHLVATAITERSLPIVAKTGAWLVITTFTSTLIVFHGANMVFENRRKMGRKLPMTAGIIFTLLLQGPLDYSVDWLLTYLFDVPAAYEYGY